MVGQEWGEVGWGGTGTRPGATGVRAIIGILNMCIR